jgi:hypothetical protein
MNFRKPVITLWVLILFLVTFTCSLTYLVTQQALRLGANELPMQLATDTAIKLQTGIRAESAIPANTIDISKSLGTFVMVYDRDKRLLATSARMGRDLPDYPKGVLDTVAQKGESRVTWQPQIGLRFATVAIPLDNGYIVAGQSLRETERLIDQIGNLVLLAWCMCLVCSVIALAVIQLITSRINRT